MHQNNSNVESDITGGLKILTDKIIFCGAWHVRIDIMAGLRKFPKATTSYVHAENDEASHREKKAGKARPRYVTSQSETPPIHSTYMFCVVLKALLSTRCESSM